MRKGRVYLWTDDSARSLYGNLTASVESLHHLDVSARDAGGLSGRFVCVRNGGAVYEREVASTRRELQSQISGGATFRRHASAKSTRISTSTASRLMSTIYSPNWALHHCPWSQP